MDDVSTSVAEQVSTTQCGDSAEAERQLERMKPIMGVLAWIPIGSGHPPPSTDAHLAFWNPCDGMDFGYWDDDEGFMTGHPFTRTFANGRPGFEEAAPIGEECGGFTHYAVLNGPADPNHDINHNWKLYNAAYKPPKQLELEAWDRLEAATGIDSLVCLRALRDAGGDEARALLTLKAGGAK